MTADEYYRILEIKAKIEGLEKREFAIDMHDTWDELDRAEMASIRAEIISLKLELNALEGEK